MYNQREIILLTCFQCESQNCFPMYQTKIKHLLLVNVKS